MQFKLLNFHKFVRNFATSLDGTFIPLMVYKATGSIRLAVLFLLGQGLCRLISNHIFKKLIEKYPQVSLIVRLVPLLIYNISLIFLEDFMVVGLILVCVSYGINMSIKNNAYGILLNYSSKKKTSKNLTLSRMVDALSAIVACVAGGLFIDWNQTALIIFSTSLYIVSVMPLLIWFIVNRKQEGVNKDFTSNAAIEYDKDPILKEKRKQIKRKFILEYLIFYTLFCIVDPFSNLYNLHLFISAPTFAQAGYITATFQAANFFGVMVVGLIGKKYDFKIANLINAVLCAIPMGIIPFIQNHLAIYVLFFVLGLTYSICSYFMMNSLMTKCKIISATNEGLLARQDGIVLGQLVAPFIVLCSGNIIPVFFVMIAALVVYSIYTTITEEKMRRKLVNYLENNEIE